MLFPARSANSVAPEEKWVAAMRCVVNIFTTVISFCVRVPSNANKHSVPSDLPSPLLLSPFLFPHRYSLSYKYDIPVLSTQITPTEPRASTADNFLTIAFRFDILVTPNAKVTVTTIGSPNLGEN